MADSAEGPSLAPMVAALERAPKLVTAKEWRFVVTFAAAERRTDLQLHDRLEPCLVQFVSRFPAREVGPDTLRIRYMLIAIKQTDVPLERVNGSGRKGRSGAAIGEEIAPAFHL